MGGGGKGGRLKGGREISLMIYWGEKEVEEWEGRK
jgi:hypothetical protein